MVPLEGCCLSGKAPAKKTKKKRRGYWKSYDTRYRNSSVRGAYLQLLARISQLPEPYPTGSRGPAPAITPHEAAALQVIKVHFDLAYRDLEVHSEALLGRHLDHSVFHEHFERIPPEYMGKVNARLDEDGVRPVSLDTA